ncbi:hypothetical protein ACWA1F_20975 [Flavobacterium sp. 3-218]
MKRILLLTILLFTIKSFGQDENPNLKNAKADFDKLSIDFEKKSKEIKDEETELKKLLTTVSKNPDLKYSEEISKMFADVKKKKTELDIIYNKYRNYKDFYLDKGISKKEIDSWFKHKHTIIDSSETNVKEVKESSKEEKEINAEVSDESSKTEKNYETYLYYGDNLIIKEFPKTDDKNIDDIIQKVLETKSESYLGDIIIPRENQEFKFYIKRNKYKTNFSAEKANQQKNETFIQVEKKFRFKSIAFEICDGFIVDVKIVVFDEKGNEHLFENQSSISFLNFSNVASKNFISYKYPISPKKYSIVNFDEFKDFRIRLSDVLVYVPKPGYNYIPNDVNFTFPTKDKDGEFLNKEKPVKYEIKETTTLQNVIELRAYTDFLALFTDSANGLVQLQGKGDFYVLPFKIFNTDLRLLDKISPYVNFSRLDADVRGVETVFNDSLNKFKIKNSTDLLQKAYLEMGAKLNLINFRFAKSVPFRLIGYFPFRYQIADVKIADQLKNVQGLGLGLGCTFEFKRFNNFGFNYSLEFSKYSYIDYNNIPELELPRAYSVFRNEAEIFYHPDSDKKQAIFLRLKTFNNTTNHDAFYQLQFGYRFSIGISEVKTKAQ